MFDTNGDRIGMMLNTDMELAYDIPVDSNLGTTSCAIFANSSMSACPDAKTKPQVQIYATVRVSPFFLKFTTYTINQPVESFLLSQLCLFLISGPRYILE